MNEQLRLIVELQNLDTIIISIKKNIEILPRKIANDQNELKTAQESYELSQRNLSALEKRKKEKDRDIGEFDAKITKLRGKTSEIKTNKEYQAYIKEVENMQKELDKAEDELLYIMESLDESKKIIELKRAKVKEEEEKLEAIKRKIELEKTKGEEELKFLMDKRKKFSNKIEKDYYDLYMNLLKVCKGQAVVEVRDEICYGCNLHIPPQQYVKIKNSSEFSSCPQCRRILYYKKPEEAAVPAN